MQHIFKKIKKYFTGWRWSRWHQQTGIRKAGEIFRGKGGKVTWNVMKIFWNDFWLCWFWRNTSIHSITCKKCATHYCIYVILHTKISLHFVTMGCKPTINYSINAYYIAPLSIGLVLSETKKDTFQQMIICT